MLLRPRCSVCTFSIGAFEGFDGEAHLLAQAAGDEAADAMGLPRGRLHDFFEAGAVRAADQFEDDGLLAALARRGRRVLGGGPLAALAFFGATGAAWGAGAGVRAWMAFQIRATAVLRSVNFLTGLRSPKGGAPAKAFQTSAKRVMGQSAESLANSFSVAKRDLGLRNLRGGGRRQ